MTETSPRAVSEQGGRPETPQQTLLVVDDEPFILTALEAYFHHMLPDTRVLLAETAAAGLELMAVQPVDVVVSDYRMPDMDGITFLRRCAREHPEARRLLFTANIDLHLLNQARDDVAFHAWLQKGSDPQLLLDAVRQALQGLAHLARAPISSAAVPS